MRRADRRPGEVAQHHEIGGLQGPRLEGGHPPEAERHVGPRPGPRRQVAPDEHRRPLRTQSERQFVVPGLIVGRARRRRPAHPVGQGAGRRVGVLQVDVLVGTALDPDVALHDRPAVPRQGHAPFAARARAEPHVDDGAARGPAASPRQDEGDVGGSRIRWRDVETTAGRAQAPGRILGSLVRGAPVGDQPDDPPRVPLDHLGEPGAEPGRVPSQARSAAPGVPGDDAVGHGVPGQRDGVPVPRRGAESPARHARGHVHHENGRGRRSQRR